MGTRTIVKCMKNLITMGFVIFTYHMFSSHKLCSNLLSKLLFSLKLHRLWTGFVRCPCDNWVVPDLTTKYGEPYWWSSLQWRHNGLDGVSNHQPHHCLLSRLSKETSKLRVTGLCEGNSPGTGEFPAQMASNAENVSIWWRHQVIGVSSQLATNKI